MAKIFCYVGIFLAIIYMAKIRAKQDFGNKFWKEIFARTFCQELLQ